MTGYDREVLRRRLGHVYSFFTGRAYVKKADMAESAGGWTLCRGLHRKFFPTITLLHASNNPS